MLYSYPVKQSSNKVKTVPVPAHINKLDIYLTGSIARIKENSVNRTCLLGDKKFDCFVIFIKSFVSKPLSVFYNADNFIWSYTDCCDFIISMCS